MTDVFTSPPGSTINNIGGDINQSISIALLQAISGGSANFFWGSGVDGVVTFAANTTLAAADNIKQYTTLTLNPGVILKSDVADYSLIIYASIALVMGAAAEIRSDMGGGGARGSSLEGGGFGGAGGNASGTVAVYAKSLTMGAAARIGGGWDGGNGLDGGTPINASNGGDGAAADPVIVAARKFCSLVTGSIGNSAINGSGSYSMTAGIGSATGGGLSQPAGVIATVKDPLLWINRTGKVLEGSGYESLRSQTPPSPGAGQGKTSAGGASTNSAGGGQGSGAASWLGTGGDGGGQTAMANQVPTPPTTGGGGGAGGAPGCVTIVICGSYSGSGTISAAGGNGGDGGDGNPNGVGPDGKNSGGASGGGGPGGVLVVWGPSALSAATLTAAGGIAGTVGASFGGGPALAGTAGSAGYPHIQMG